MLEDILALPDITEVESHRLSELCRILNALEGLFSGEADEVGSFLSGRMEHLVIISAAFLCSGLCTTLAKILVPFRTLGLSFHKNMLEFMADTYALCL
jgi:hypothetical protein